MHGISSLYDFLTCWSNAHKALVCVSVTYFQSCGVFVSHRWNHGTLTLEDCSPPASNKRILQSPTSESLAARTEPAVPPPTVNKSISIMPGKSTKNGRRSRGRGKDILLWSYFISIHYILYSPMIKSYVVLRPAAPPPPTFSMSDHKIMSTKIQAANKLVTADHSSLFRKIILTPW
jgi:hypothetical protein